jgi:hypothetical protein
MLLYHTPTILKSGLEMLQGKKSAGKFRLGFPLITQPLECLTQVHNQQHEIRNSVLVIACFLIILYDII